MTDEQPETLTAAGGWCAPSEVLYDPPTGPDWEALFTLPDMTVRRGGIGYPKPGTPEWDAAQERRLADEAIGALIIRNVGSALTAQDEALATALSDGIRHGLIVHAYAAPEYVLGWHDGWGPYRFLGIALEERTRPTELVAAIHHHLTHGYSDWDEDDD